MGRLLSLDPYACTRSSLGADEPLLATAVEDTDTWLLLEQDGRWGPKVAEATTIGDALSAHLEPALARFPRARFQLIRRGDCGVNGWRLVIARSGDTPSVHAIWLPERDLILSLDIDALLSGRLPPSAVALDDPLFLVCTHGKRDPCCARWGQPLYQAVSAVAEARTWQCSHLGGHRFAPTMLILPWGYVLGRVPASSAAAIVSATDAGCLESLDRVRGRTSLAAPAQAAELLLRRRLGELRLDSVRVRRSHEVSEHAWRVELEVDGQQHVVEVARTLGEEVQGSCNKPDKRTRVSHWVTR